MSRRTVILILAVALSSCQDFVNGLAKLHLEYIELEAEVARMNTTVASIAEIISSMDDDMIVRVNEIVEDDVCVGYSIVYQNGKTVAVYHGTDGKKGDKGDDGHNGKDGHSPVLSIRKAPDGLWYWTVDGQWMTDSFGEKVPVAGENGITPLLRIEAGRWLISYDAGYSWQDYGYASTSVGDSPILDVDYRTYEDRVVFTLRDGTVFSAPKAESGIRLLCNFPSVIETAVGRNVELGFKVEGEHKGYMTVDVMAGEMFSWNTSVQASDTCTVSLRALSPAVTDELFTVFVNCDDKTWMKVFSFKLTIPEENTDLSKDGTANCYVVSTPGRYCFRCTVKGCTEESVGDVSYADVIWESYGTAEKPAVGDVVSEVYCTDGKICFTSGKDGNALIAAKNGSGEILWSWHIWVCDGFYPENTAQEYLNGAGTMMDRNLGATSAVPGNPLAFGLHYEWGRKDPFPGPANASSNSCCLTTLDRWPEAVTSSAETGTIAYSVAHPDTYIVASSSRVDWMNYSDSGLWSKEKTAYDPCPRGWRVPDGGSSGIWAKAFGYASYMTLDIYGDVSLGGIDLGLSSARPLGNYHHIWYPVSGTMDEHTSNLYKVNTYGGYWTCTKQSIGRSFSFYYDLDKSRSTCGIQITGSTDNAYSHPVRCQATEYRKP